MKSANGKRGEEPVNSYGKMASWTVLVVIAIAVLFIFGSGRDAFIQPGKLTMPHSGVNDCSSCHSAAVDNPLHWFAMALSEHEKNDSKLCLDCHALGNSAAFAHSVPVDELEAMTAELKREKRTDRTTIIAFAQTLKWTPKSDHELQCRTCHREHNGSDDLVTADSSAHCQSCHVQSFGSFDSGHPEFSDFPFSRRTRINFDHVSHVEKHFVSSDYAGHAPKTCIACHSVDERGVAMRSGGFDSSCGACHNQQIRGAGRASALGFEVLSAPGLDLAALEAGGAMIGEWPAFSEEAFSPFMELLLRGDEHYAQVKDELASLDFLDLSEATEQQLQAVEVLAWCVKMLIYDIERGGAAFLQQRIEQSLGRPLPESLLTELLGMMPEDIIHAIQLDWFPNLSSEVPMHRQGKKFATSAGSPVDQPVQRQEFSNGVADRAEVDNESLIDEDELLGDDALLGDDELLSDDNLLDDQVDIALAEESSNSSMGALNEEQWVTAGGWYRDGYALRYRPTGHADRFIAAWLNLMVETTASDALLDELASENSPGSCVTCHSIDEQIYSVDGEPVQSVTVNWQTSSGLDIPRGFTEFRHLPHLNMLDDSGCETCHALDEQAEYQLSFEHRSPYRFTSNFHVIEKSQCDSCHNKKSGNQNCLSCHYYHAAEHNPVINDRELPKKKLLKK